MSIYSEIENDLGVYPGRIYLSFDGIVSGEPAPWNLPKIDILDVWGHADLRSAFRLISGGDTPTTYSRRMADMMRVITGPSLLGLDEDPVDAEFTRALEVIGSIREPVDAEVVYE